MMRIGYLASDFNPMILMLGEAEDCRALAGMLRRFSRDQKAVDFAELEFCRLLGTALTLTAAKRCGTVEKTGTRSFVWHVTTGQAAGFADRLDNLADQSRLAGSEQFAFDSHDAVVVVISRGEYPEDFLT